MKPVLMFIIAASATLLVAFAVHDIVNLGMGFPALATHPPEEFREAIGNALAYAFQHKGLSITAFMICLIAPFIRWNPTIRVR